MIALSGSGTVIAETFGTPNANPCVTQVVPIAGGTPIYCDTTGLITDIQLSPDGTLVAATIPGTDPSDDVTNIYKNGTLASAVPGDTVIWLDNNRLLVSESSNSSTTALPSAIYDYLGNLLGNGASSDLFGYEGCSRCQLVSTDSLYDGYTILSYMTGATTWASADYFQTGKGAVDGSQVILAAGDYVLAEPY